MNIAFFETDSYEKSYFEKHLKDHNLHFYYKALEEIDLKHLYQTDILVVFIYSHVTKEIIENMPCLKFVVTMSTGYEHIDIDSCKKAGIFVSNVPKYGGAPVAEHTFALILGLIRNIPKAVNRTIHDDFSIDGLMGVNLEGKTIGIIGYGTIGSHVAKISQGFKMKVLASTESRKKGFENGVEFVSLKKLLKNSDIVTIHVPYNKKTHHMINKKTLSLMKKGSFLINTSRGGVIDTNALSLFLDKKKIAGFAADVLEGECELKEAHQPLKCTHHEKHDWNIIRQNHKLLKKPNVIITPHIAFYTKESVDTILKQTSENIKRFIKGKPINIIRTN